MSSGPRKSCKKKILRERKKKNGWVEERRGWGVKVGVGVGFDNKKRKELKREIVRFLSQSNLYFERSRL